MFWTEGDPPSRFSISTYFLINSFSLLIIILFSNSSLYTSKLYRASSFSSLLLCAWSEAFFDPTSLFRKFLFSSYNAPMTSITSAIFSSVLAIFSLLLRLVVLLWGRLLVVVYLLLRYAPMAVHLSLGMHFLLLLGSSKNESSSACKNHVKYKKRSHRQCHYRGRVSPAQL